MIPNKLWDKKRFPVVYENGKEKAILVDVESFDQIEMVLDNLLNREAEPEDSILAASDLLKRLVAQTQEQTPSADWEKELNEL